jgi:hypothetical protein
LTFISSLISLLLLPRGLMTYPVLGAPVDGLTGVG